MRTGVAMFCALAALASWSGSAQAQTRWVRADSDNFIIHTDMDAETARRYAVRLETFDRVLRAQHQLSAKEAVRRKLPIYLLRRDADIRRINPGAPRSLQGFFVSHLDDTYAVAVASETNRNDPILQHEYVHHFMLQRFPGGYPGWLVEGYAEYFMTLEEKPRLFEVGRANENRASWITRGSWLPFEVVLKARPVDLKGADAGAMFYAQSWALTHWFLSDPARTRQLDAYIAAVGRGGDPVKAMTEVTGMRPNQLERTVRTYLATGFPIRRFTMEGREPPAVTTAPLPASAADVLLLSLRVKNDNGIDAPEDRTDGPVLLGDVRKAAARHPGDRLAELTLARAEIKLGDLARAETLLQGRVAADPKDVEALQLLAAARLKAAENAPPEQARKLRLEAGGFAGRAHKLDPDHYQTLVAYAQTREPAGNYPTENDLQVLLDALDLAPQVGVLRVKTALALAERKRLADAANVLRPVAFNPHGGATAEKARAVLATLEGASAGGAKPSGKPAAAPAPSGR